MENGQDGDVLDGGAGDHHVAAMDEDEAAGGEAVPGEPAAGTHKRARISFEQIAAPLTRDAVKMVDRSLPSIKFTHRLLLWLSLILILLSLCSDVPAQLHDLHIKSLGEVDSFRGEVTVLWYSLTRSF
jgi:hypothetical protein